MFSNLKPSNIIYRKKWKKVRKMGVKGKNLLRRRKLSRLRAHSHLFLISAILLVQLVYYVYICFRLTPYTKYMFAASESLSIIFILFLSNSSGKNEFKLAWMFPVLVSPIFGISIYFLTKHNTGWTRIKRKLQKTRRITNESAEMIFEKALRNDEISQDGKKSAAKAGKPDTNEGRKDFKSGDFESSDFESSDSESSDSESGDFESGDFESGGADSRGKIFREIEDLETYTISTELFPSFARNRTRYFSSGRKRLLAA